eukprot:TRINITY_DN7933_c2_g1_i1.p1 TRINITY_DN7933_c2_g1~~TRINITY_DN7933_c2_g1_i1.p1  ORF type:complete len:307 (-),score=37.45 TRINITY_DN7933_c2_g1_i1:1388-2308(-)
MTSARTPSPRALYSTEGEPLIEDLQDQPLRSFPWSKRGSRKPTRATRVINQPYSDGSCPPTEKACASCCGVSGNSPTIRKFPSQFCGAHSGNETGVQRENSGVPSVSALETLKGRPVPMMFCNIGLAIQQAFFDSLYKAGCVHLDTVGPYSSDEEEEEDEEIGGYGGDGGLSDGVWDAEDETEKEHETRKENNLVENHMQESSTALPGKGDTLLAVGEESGKVMGLGRAERNGTTGEELSPHVAIDMKLEEAEHMSCNGAGMSASNPSLDGTESQRPSTTQKGLTADANGRHASQAPSADFTAVDL